MKKILILVVLMMMVGMMFATTIYVNSGNSIQTAINSAGNNDIIIVRDGLYQEDVSIPQSLQGLTLRSENGPELCTIESDLGTAITITGSLINIDGFTIIEGTIAAVYLNCYAVGTEITNCIFDGNGVAIFAWEPIYIVSDCIFMNNTGTYDYDYTIYSFSNSEATETFTNNLFLNNTSNVDLELINASNNHVSLTKNCTFKFTGGIGNMSAGATVEDCIFSLSYLADVGTISYCAFSNSPTYTSATNCVYNANFEFTTGMPYLTDDTPTAIKNGSDGDTDSSMGWCSLDDGSDTANFHGKWNWVSFPRMPRMYDEEYDAETIVEDLEPYAKEIQHELVNMEWVSFPYPGYWDNSGLLEDFQSTLGYKVDMATEYASYNLDRYGGLANPNLDMTLESGSESWVGYFLENSGTPDVVFDFEDVWDDDIKSIKHENWAKWRKTPTSAWYGYTNVPWVGLRYGEMVVVEIFGTSDIDFKWNPPLGSRGAGEAPVSEYFTYDTKADYIPIQVELDESNPAEEVGAFIDDVCKGYGKVIDGKAVILAYIIDEVRSGELEFVLYNDDRSTGRTIDEYYVLNYRTEEYEKESIHLGALQENYVVSLTGAGDSVPVAEQVYLTNHPNPFNPSTVVSYNVPAVAKVTLQIFNAKGQLVKTLVNGKQEQGNYSVTWNGKDKSGNAVSSGIYYSRIETAGKVLNKKMVLLK